MKKRIFCLLLAIITILSLVACGGETDTPGTQGTKDKPEITDGSWAVYWYLCGSDLETNGGFASTDLQEMMEVTLPENVNVVIQTGGANVWQNELMDPAKLQRWLYNSEGLKLLEETETANMGDAQTLYDFLAFADANYPADKVAVTFWNHGGGSVSGAAFDEIHGLDSLDLAEMYQAFDAVWPANKENPALELVGFDTCLMATVDVAAIFQNFSKYLVASEEVEPGNGWLYSGWLGELAANPDMEGDDLGIAICNTYYQGCEAVGTQDQTTLSVTDLTKLTPLLEAYESFGEEAFVAASQEPGFFAELGRAAAQSENYGGNTKEQGYTNMVDLGHLARQTAWMLPSAQDVSDALEECVLYQVGGIYRSEATGLSCYYSYNGDINDFNGYINVGAGTAFKHLYAYGLTGELAEGGDEYLASLDIKDLPKIVTLADMDWDGAPLDLNDEGTAILNLGPEANDILAGIGFSLYYVDEANDQMLLLGTDNDMTADWEKGVFYDNFRGVWGAIDGRLVYMELSFEGEDYNLYSVPILLNDEAYNLQVAYDFTAEEWHILGASQGLDESGMASKELRLLEEGDVITTIWKMASYSGDDEFQMYEAEEVTVTANTAFGEAPLFDGKYSMVFEMWDAAGNYAYSDAVTFDCMEGEIITTVYED
ncbi:MAG: clostripain [Lachnospiraceae bacterium]|nr:clostripain [Lachnospiraceae bacterium]